MTALILVRSGFNLVVFGTILAVLSYLRTENFRKRTGMNPWRIPPLVWALASFFIIVLGTLLSVIACATTKAPARQARPTGPVGHPGTPGTGNGTGAGAGAGYSPGGGLPSATWPAQANAFASSGAYVAPPMGSPPPSSPAGFPPGWQADPMGRHQHRYWDGARWTEHVADGGVSSVDPVRSS